MNKRTKLLCLVLGWVFPWAAAQAQAGANPAEGSAFAFATPSQGRAVLGARDDYVRATSPLERSARLQTGEAVDEEQFTRYMEATVLEWGEEERRRLGPFIERLDRFLPRLNWKRSGRVLLVQVAPRLEGDSPHTRANAIMLPSNVVTADAPLLSYVLSHELFHVLTRGDPETKEKLYAAIGFRRCGRVDIPEPIARLRITNPDAVDNRHTIAVRYRGQPVEALPFMRFRSESVDPHVGFLEQAQIAWLLADRDDGNCRVRPAKPSEAGVPPQEFQGLVEQVGRNTVYFLHAEEILADNFSLLFAATVNAGSPAAPSPEILERMRVILFR